MLQSFAGIYTAPSRELIYGSKYAENVYVGTTSSPPCVVDIRCLPHSLCMLMNPQSLDEKLCDTKPQTLCIYIPT